MTLQLNLSDEEVRDLSYYLTAAAAASVRSCDYVPDVLFTIIGQLAVDVCAYYKDFVNKTDESSKEPVSD